MVYPPPPRPTCRPPCRPPNPPGRLDHPPLRPTRLGSLVDPPRPPPNPPEPHLAPLEPTPDQLDHLGSVEAWVMDGYRRSPPPM